jgi:hypothetical protein
MIKYYWFTLERENITFDGVERKVKLLKIIMQIKIKE